MRLFLAVNLPTATRDALYADTAPLRGAASGVKWVAAAALHVTLKFLGERDAGLVERIGTVLSPVVQRHRVFDAMMTMVGAFPNFRRPRVVWLGMTGAAALAALAADVDTALASLDIERERRPFQAHLTLGRVRDPLRSREAAVLADAAARVRSRREFPVETVDLMQSELGPGGSRYTVRLAMPLHARGT